MQITSNIVRRGCRAYTLAEVMVAVGVFIGMFLALYVGFAASFSIIQNARENLRATQILMQRMETVRLYTWTQLNSATYVKPTTDGRELLLVRRTEPDRDVALLLARLNVELPPPPPRISLPKASCAGDDVVATFDPARVKTPVK